MAVEESTLGVFAQPLVRFHIIQGHGLQEDDIQQVRPRRLLSLRIQLISFEISEALTKQGAEAASPTLSQGDGKVALDTVTHIISNTIDFPDYDATTDPCLSKAVVKPEWVSASLMKGRQANVRQYSPDPRMFFSGLIVCCADLPEGDHDAIIGYVLAVGGLYSSKVTKQVTHVIALTMDSDKCQLALGKKLDCKIVLPHW